MFELWTDLLQLDLLWRKPLAHAVETSMQEQRRVRLSRYGRFQAIGIPAAFELPGDEAIMRRDGDRLVIEPVLKRGLVALLKSMKPLDEAFPEISNPVPAAHRV